MPTAVRARPRAGRRWRRAGLRLLAYATIGLAVLFALARLLLPWYLSDVQRVEALVSGALGEPVRLGQVTLDWEGSRPALSVEGLVIGADELLVGRARLMLDPYVLLPRRRLVHELVITDIDLQLERGADGRVRVAGLAGLKAGGDPRRLLGWFDQIAVSGLKLRYTDPAHRVQLALDQLSALVDARGLVIRQGSRETGLRLVLDWDADLTPTAGYLQAQSARLGGVGRELTLGDTRIDALTLAGQLWYRPQRGSDWWIGELGLTDLVLSDAGIRSEGPVMAGAPRPLPALRLRAQARIGTARTLAAGQLVLGDEEPVAWSLVGDPQSALLVAEGLPVAPVASIAQALPALPPPMRGLIAQLQPRGLLGRVEWSLLKGDQGAYRQLRADLEGVDFDSRDGKLPGLSGLRGRLTADDRGVLLDLALVDAGLSAPLRFREIIPIERAEGRILMVPEPGGLSVEAPSLKVRGPGYEVEGNLGLQFREGERPFLDLLATVPAGEVASAPYFWLIDVMPPATVAWLDGALSTGRVSEGRWLWRGPVGKGALPYREHEGRMEATARLDEAPLAFHPDWPIGESLKADLLFTDRGLQATVLDARLAGNPVQGLRVELPELRQPVLRLKLEGQAAEAAPLLTLLRQSPLRQRHAETLALMEVSGPSAVDVELVLPLKRELGVARYQGRVELAGVDFRAEAWTLDFQGLRGKARFDQDGFRAETLRGLAHGAAVDVALALGRVHTGDAALMHADAQGHFEARRLAQAYPGIGRWLGNAQGAADFAVEVRVLDPEEAPLRTDVAIRSDLVGVGLALPAPLGKPARLSTPFAADLRFMANQPGAVEVRWGDRLTLAGEWRGDAGLRAAIALGDVPAPAAPVEGVALAAVLDGRDPQAWLGLLTAGLAGAGLGGEGLNSLDLLLTGAPELNLGDTRVRASRGATDGELQLSVEGPEVDGRLSWMPARADRAEALHADFRRLWLPAPREPTAGAAAPPGWSADPRRLPTLHLKADDFRLGAARLGSTRLEAWPTRDGLHVDLFEARSAALKLAGDGEWVVLPDGTQQSRFELRFTAEDLGQMLLSLGFAERIEKAQTLAEISGVWPGSPAEFALNRLQGAMQVSVGGGRFVGLEPGAGRLLGLFSIRELPRRLALDFRDFFGEGLSFDRIDGRFELSAGNAWTQDLKVAAPSAEIRVSGRTGLSARDYDQEIIVSPQYGTVLPVVGGLAGGPAGLAAGLLAQGVLTQDNDVGRVHYAVTGSWESPRIARMPNPREASRAREPARVPKG